MHPYDYTSALLKRDIHVMQKSMTIFGIPPPTFSTHHMSIQAAAEEARKIASV